MKITVRNNKTNENNYFYSWKEIIKAFECDTFGEHFTLKSDYDSWIEEIKNTDYCDEEEKEEELKYAQEIYPEKVEILETEEEYCKELVRFEQWTSPRGVEPVFEIIEIGE